MARRLIPWLLVALAVSRPALADGNLWTVLIAGGQEYTFRAREPAGKPPLVDVRSLAPDLDLLIDQRDDKVTVRDARGMAWTAANGAMLLEGPAMARALGEAAVVGAGTFLLPLDAVADLAGRTLVIDGTRALLIPHAPPDLTAAPAASHAPAGWETVQIPKTASELAETRRLDGDARGDRGIAAVPDVMPAAHEKMAVAAGVGFAPGLSGAGELSAAGTADGLRVNLNTFVTYARDGATYRSGRMTVQDSSAKWTFEMGDLLSDIRGLARGVRFAASPVSWWHPSVGLYARSPTLSSVDGTVFAYRDVLRLPADIDVRTEVLSDGSVLGGVRWLRGRATLDTFFRDTRSRHTMDRGASVSYELWRGISAQAGARITTGAAPEHWLFAGLNVPIGNWATATVERTRRSSSLPDTSAVGLQVPIGRLRMMQRYQWSDVAFMHDVVDLTVPGYRQLQSIASYSVARRLQLSYQVATQWSASADVRRSTELQSEFVVSPRTSLHAVTGFPDVTSPQVFRAGVQQTLGHGFAVAADVGRIPAFQTPNTEIVPQEQPGFLVMVRRTFSQSTPAAGSDVRGRVIDQLRQPVGGVVITLGRYVTTSHRDGSYRFAHVPNGEFDLALDQARLPAQYAAGGARHHLALTHRTAVEIDLRVIPLDSIYGRVYIDRNHNGQFDAGEGVANVVMRLGTGAATVTDAEGEYGFYNLPPQRYRVAVDAERLDRSLAIVSDGGIAVDLNSKGGANSSVVFQLLPKQRPIIMQSLPQ